MQSLKERINNSYYFKFIIVAAFMFVLRLTFNLLSDIKSNYYELVATSIVVALVIIWSFYKAKKRLENDQ